MSRGGPILLISMILSPRKTSPSLVRVRTTCARVLLRSFLQEEGEGGGGEEEERVGGDEGGKVEEMGEGKEVFHVYTCQGFLLVFTYHTLI